MPKKRSKGASAPIPSTKPLESSVWIIEIADTALEDIGALAKVDRERVLKFIYQRLRNHPDPKRLAEPLFGSFCRIWAISGGGFPANL